MADKLTKKQRADMVQRMINAICDDARPNELREEIVHLLCAGSHKGYDNMTDEELQAEHDAFGFDQDDEG